MYNTGPLLIGWSCLGLVVVTIDCYCSELVDKARWLDIPICHSTFAIDRQWSEHNSRPSSHGVCTMPLNQYGL
jgi:hypothetical protein